MLNQQQPTSFITSTQIVMPGEERPAQENYNKGFVARKALLGVTATANTEISLNRYSFFERLFDELLPNSKVEISLVIESDGNLIWQAVDDCRVIITKLQLIVIPCMI